MLGLFRGGFEEMVKEAGDGERTDAAGGGGNGGKVGTITDFGSEVAF